MPILDRLTSGLQSLGLIQTPAQLISQNNSSLSLPLKVIVSEAVSGSASVAAHPIEDGSTVADHVVVEPDGLAITTIFSDVGNFFSFQKMDVKTKIDILQKMKNEKHVLTYSGPVFSNILYSAHDTTFSPCVISSISLNRNLRVGSGVEASITLQKIKIVKSKISQSDKLKYRSRVKRKEAQTKKVTTAEKSKVKSKKSILKNLTG